MEWLTALAIVILIAAWIWSRSGDSNDDTKTGTVGTIPSNCTCLWFKNHEGEPYRALTDVNCRYHEGS